MRLISVLCLAGLSAGAQAADVPAWDRSTFGENVEIAGRDGWENGYERDRWFGVEGVALAATDDNNGDSPGTSYGSGWAADNWLIRGEDVGQGSVVTRLFNEDDDTIGVVLNHDGFDTFYMVAHSAGSVPPPMTGDGARFFVIRVENGSALVLGNVPRSLPTTDWSELEVRVNDGHVVVFHNGQQILDAVDSNPLPPGRAGFYTYDSGYDGGFNTTNALFDMIEVSWLDEDGDGVIDDEDNCEKAPNKDQRDSDLDGLGDACDDPGPGDTDPDTDPDTTENPDGPYLDEGVTVDCGCNGGAAAGFAPLLLAGLVLLRRRRTQASMPVS